MTTPRHQPPRLLGLVLLAAIAGCAGSPQGDPAADAVADYKTRIQDVVADPARAATLVQLVDQTDAQRRAAEAEAAAFRDDFQRLNADYDAGKDRFAALLSQHRARRRQIAETLLSLRAQMVAGTSPQEWDSLSKVRERTLETMFKAGLDPTPSLEPEPSNTLVLGKGGPRC